MDILSEVKIRLEIVDDSKDLILKSFINEIIEKVKNYCNIKEIPEDLNFTLVSMTVDLFKFKSSDNKDIKSEKQGNRSLEYFSIDDIDKTISDYSNNLNRFRKIRTV